MHPPLPCPVPQADVYTQRQPWSRLLQPRPLNTAQRIVACPTHSPPLSRTSRVPACCQTSARIPNGGSCRRQSATTPHAEPLHSGSAQNADSSTALPPPPSA